MPIAVGEKAMRIEFSNGGLASAGNGRFMTCDEQLQQALESHPEFGISYRLQDTIDVQDSTAAMPKQPKQPEQDAEYDDTPAEQTDEDTMVFANFNELRDYLIQEHGCSTASVRSLSLAIAQAKKLGLDVEISK